MGKRVTVVDYGIGNVYSVCNALSSVGATPALSADPDKIATAERLILPGVGAFSKAMESLGRRGLEEAVSQFIGSGRPMLGICIGMQVLMESSTEFGEYTGLKHIEGGVEKIPAYNKNGDKVKVPHIGWAEVKPTRDFSDGPLSELNSKEDSYFYFVHSFMCKPKNPDHLLATTTYRGLNITAAIGRENIIGLQFHPERSGRAGLRLLSRFAGTFK
jgi:glutamine amidotransferase